MTIQGIKFAAVRPLGMNVFYKCHSCWLFERKKPVGMIFLLHETMNIKYVPYVTAMQTAVDSLVWMMHFNKHQCVLKYNATG